MSCCALVGLATPPIAAQPAWRLNATVRGVDSAHAVTVVAVGQPSFGTVDCSPVADTTPRTVRCTLLLPATDTAAVVTALHGDGRRTGGRVRAGESAITLTLPDAVKSGRPATLATVTVRTTAPKRSRGRTEAALGDPARPSLGNYAWTGSIAPDALGDLGAELGASLLAGLDGLALVGLDAADTRVNVNGLADEGPLPALLEKTVSAATSPWDPRAGNAVGAAVNVHITTGRPFHVVKAASFLSSSPDARGAVRGASTTSLGASGPVTDRLRYAFAFDATRPVGATAAEALDREVFERFGVPAVGLAALLDTARTAGIPIDAALPGAIPTQVNALAQFTLTPDTARSATSADPTTLLTLRARGAPPVAAGSPLASASTWRDRASSQLGVQLQHARFMGRDAGVHQTFALAVSHRRSRSSPISTAARIERELPAELRGDGGVTTLALGGGGIIGGTQQFDRMTLLSESIVSLPFARIPWIAVQATGWQEQERFDPEAGAALTVRVPVTEPLASPRRLVVARERSAPRTTAVARGAGVAIASHVTSLDARLRLYGGVRADVQQVRMTPVDEGVGRLAALGGATRDTRLTVSPRVGFVLRPARGEENGMMGYGGGDLGSVLVSSPTLISGGVGVFRGDGAAAVLRAQQGVRAVGVEECPLATNVGFSWRELAVDIDPIALRCGGAADVGIPAAEAASPDVAVRVHPARTPSAIRAELALLTAGSLRTTVTRRRPILELRAIGASTRDLPDVVDVNVGTGNAVRLPFENRVAFSGLSGIDPVSARAPLLASRADSALSRVLRTAPTRRLETLTISARLTLPEMLGGSSQLTVEWNGARDRRLLPERRALDGRVPTGTVAAEGIAEWRAGVLYGVRTGPVLTTFNAQAGYGARFTPLVAGDVDQDGRSGDVAALPRASDDPATAQAIDALAATLPAAVARCLAAGAGRLAPRAGCRAGWTVNTVLSVAVFEPIVVAGRSLLLSLSMTRPVTAVERLLFGAASRRDWEPVAFADPILLVPTGFDRSRGAYSYAVNPRFGRTADAVASAVRAPRLFLRGVLELTPPVSLRYLMNTLALTDGMRGASLDSVRALGAFVRPFRSPYFPIISDSSVRPAVGDSIWADWTTRHGDWLARERLLAGGVIARWRRQSRLNPRVLEREYEAFTRAREAVREAERLEVRTLVPPELFGRLPASVRRRLVPGR